MNESKQKAFPLPDMGEVMGCLVDLLGVPKDEEPIQYHELKRLRKGGLAPNTYAKVLRKTMDGIAALFLGLSNVSSTIDQVLAQRRGAPVKMYHWQKKGQLIIPVPEREAPIESSNWKFDALGNVTNFRDILLHDWNEFLEWHQYIIEQCADAPFTNEMGIMFWLNVFVVPFLAANMHEYQYRMTALESGMPGGELWFLPHLDQEKTSAGKFKVLLPVGKVLAWWEDLLGTDLVKHSHLLCGRDSEEARRQVRGWMSGAHPPDKATIERWCKVEWLKHYHGTFVDNRSKSLRDRWESCKSFLIGKGLHENAPNWLDKMDADSRGKFKSKYKGERLEREIPPFQSTSFAAFFDSIDPVATNLPVEDLIERVALRYAAPSNRILKARLHVAAAFQRAYLKLVKWKNEGTALFVCKHFSDVYNYIVELHRDGNEIEKVIAKLKSLPTTGIKCSCEWLYDETLRYEMVTEIKNAANTSSTVTDTQKA